MKIKIRNDGPTDFEQVQVILLATFLSDAESKLVAALRAEGKAVISLVAVNGDHVLGHILFSVVTATPSSDAKGIGLAPLAVHPDAQSQGVGSKLIQEGLRRCKELGFDYCVILGRPNYYQRFGFEKASSVGVENEYGVDEEFMLIRFSNHALMGLVQYAPEFGVFAV